jgi:hypothetical protein
MPAVVAAGRAGEVSDQPAAQLARGRASTQAARGPGDMHAASQARRRPHRAEGVTPGERHANLRLPSSRGTARDEVMWPEKVTSSWMSSGHHDRRHHPYHGSAGDRCGNPEVRRSRSPVRCQVMRCVARASSAIPLSPVLLQPRPARDDDNDATEAVEVLPLMIGQAALTAACRRREGAPRPRQRSSSSSGAPPNPLPYERRETIATGSSRRGSSADAVPP